jgi:uncharacterized protein YecA (UPF0149 family)
VRQETAQENVTKIACAAIFPKPFDSSSNIENLRQHVRRSTLEKEHLEAELQSRKPKVGRNDPCPCGSGRKYKKCCGA